LSPHHPWEQAIILEDLKTASLGICLPGVPPPSLTRSIDAL
jgi:hypothetical protein